MENSIPDYEQVYDIMIVGGGPIGLSTAYQCAKAGKTVLLLERFTLFNQSGSSSGQVRMFRTMYTESFMADLAYEAIHEWKKLEKACGEELIDMCGLLNFGDPEYKAGPEGTLMGPIDNLKRHNMKYQELDVTTIEKEFPFQNLPKNFKGIWAPDNGCINVPRVIRVLAKLSQDHGACLLQWAKVERLKVNDTGIEAEVIFGQEKHERKQKSFRARKCAITSGAYTNHIVEPSFGLRLNLDIWEMSQKYYALDSTLEYKGDPNAKSNTLQARSGKPFKSMWFQFMDNDGDDWQKSNLFYGFPSMPGGIDGACISIDNAYRRITDPSERQLNPCTSISDLKRIRTFIEKHLHGVDVQPNFCGTCLQTNVYDNMFVLDHLPDYIEGWKNVAIFTAGWAFKFIPLIGIILKQMLMDSEGVDTKYDISHFKISRSDPATGNSIISYCSLNTKVQFQATCKGSSHHAYPPHKIRLTKATTVESSDRVDGPNQIPQTRPFSRAMFARRIVQAANTNRHMALINIAREGEVDFEIPSKIPRLNDETNSEHQMKHRKPKIGIIGAGAAGLYAALILKDLDKNFDCDILEANADRAGGRIYTHYFGDAHNAKPGTREYYNYVDMGAMRFPNIPIHDRVIGKEYWSLVNYINQNKSEGLPEIKLINYFMSDPYNLMYFNGIKMLSDDVDKTSDNDPFKFMPTDQIGKLVSDKYDQLRDAAFNNIKQAMKEDFDKGFAKLMEHDHQSVRGYMQTFLSKQSTVSLPGEYSNAIIDWIETMDSSSGMYNLASLTETVMDSFDFDYPDSNGSVEWKAIEGGTTRLVDGMLDILKAHKTIPQMGKPVNKIAMIDDSGVQLSFGNGKKPYSKVYDHVITTVPLSVLRTMDISDLSEGKRTAMRVLNYDSSTKVAISFKTRFWQKKEHMPLGPCFGGSSSTDLPIRTIVYPSYGVNLDDAPGVLLASYTWTQDAARMGSIPHDQRVELCLKNLEAIHGSVVREQYLGLDHTWSVSWYHEQYSQGAFALFQPCQFRDLFKDMIKPEMRNKLHFAGEATSVHHAWVVGSLNSAYRCVKEILMSLPDSENLLNQLKGRWGTVDEIDNGITDFTHIDKAAGQILHPGNKPNIVPKRADETNNNHR